MDPNWSLLPSLRCEGCHTSKWNSFVWVTAAPLRAFTSLSIPMLVRGFTCVMAFHELAAPQSIVQAPCIVYSNCLQSYGKSIGEGCDACT